MPADIIRRTVLRRVQTVRIFAKNMPVARTFLHILQQICPLCKSRSVPRHKMIQSRPVIYIGFIVRKRSLCLCNKYFIGCFPCNDVFVYRIRHQAGCHPKADHDYSCNRSKGRFLILRNIPDTPFYSNLAKCKSSRIQSIRLAAGKKCPHIIRNTFSVHVPNHSFITGHFHILTEQKIRDPAQRIEPVDRENHISKRLPQVVFSRKMCLFMLQDVFQCLSVQAGRNVENRMQDAQDKRRLDLIADPDLSRIMICPGFSVLDRGCERFLKLQIVNDGI